MENSTLCPSTPALSTSEKLLQIALRIATSLRAEFEPRRVEKAIAIVSAKEIRKTGQDRYCAKAHSTTSEYCLNLTRLECGCPDHKRVTYCKHLIAAFVLRELERESKPRLYRTLDECIAYCTTRREEEAA